MGRPAKSLAQLVRDGGFRTGRHHGLLAGPGLAVVELAALQEAYRRAGSELERRAVAREFQQAARLVSSAAALETASVGSAAAGLAGLAGRAGSARQLQGFFPAYLRHEKGPLCGEAFRLEPWQKRFLAELYRRDRRGRRVYRTAVLGLPRGCGKTPMAVGVGLYELVSRADAPEVYLAAGSRAQAGIGFGFARAAIEEGRLADLVRVTAGALCRRGGAGVLRALSSEGRLQHGLSPAAAIVDELWTFETERQRQTYVALASALHKREDAFLLAISTAGYDLGGPLGDLYQAGLQATDVEVSADGCLTIARDRENGLLLWWYGAPEGCDLEDERVWRAVNPASWLSLEALRRQLHDPALGEGEFRRLHLNQWVSGRQVWIPASTWSDLQSEEQIPEGAAVYLGVDVGLYHDATAVCVAYPAGEGRIILRVRVWSADPEAPAHSFVEGGKIELAEIEQHILALARRYRVRELAYDPRFFNRSAELLEQAGVQTIAYFPGSGPMAGAFQAFYQHASEGRLGHDGDPILAAHIQATAARQTEAGWKIERRKNSDRIDATIACVLAVERAQHHQLHRPPRFYPGF